MNDIENTAEDADVPNNKSAVALRLEKARLVKAEKKEKELAAIEAQKAKSENIVNEDKPRVSRRKSMELSGPLTFREDLMDPNFKYRWVLDDGWKLSQRVSYGYEFVLDPDGAFAAIDLAIDSTKFGSVVGRSAGGDKMMYLMRIPLDEYNLAQQEKVEENNRRLTAKPDTKEIYEKQFDVKRDT